MPEPSEVERDVEAVSDCLTDLRLLVESVTPDTQALKRARWADRQGHEFLAALEARLKEVEGERNLLLQGTESYFKEALAVFRERAEAQLRVAREGLAPLFSELDDYSLRISDERLDELRDQIIMVARETLARLDTPEQAASGSGGEA